jgi:PAS domain S-box-containing protein
MAREINKGNEERNRNETDLTAKISADEALLELQRYAATFDISTRRKIEIEKNYNRRSAEERSAWLQAIIDLIPAGIWISDHTGKVVIVNHEAVKMYRGLSPLSGRPEEYTSYKLFLPDTDQPVMLEPYVPKGPLNGVILDFERFDGTRGIQVASTEAIRDKDGNIVNYVAIAMDITAQREAEKELKHYADEKKHAEEVLQEKEAQLKITATINAERQRLFKVLETLPVNICLLDTDFKVRFANRSFRETFGESKGRPCYDYICGLNQPCENCQAWKALETGQPQHWFFTAPDNRIFDVYDLPFIDIDGTLLILEMNFDITERIKAEENLRQSEERFAKIFYNSPDAISIIRKRDHLYLDVNQKFLDLIEYSREEVIGRTPWQLNLLAEEDSLIELLIANAIEKGSITNFEYKLRSKSGKLINVISSAVLMNLNDELCRIVMMKDVSKEKKLEAEIARLDRLNLIGEMAASIGHEIRNPMTSVRGFLQMLGSKPEYQADSSYFKLMIEEIDRANVIITEYLNMAKNKRVELQPHPLNLLIDAIMPVIQSDANLRDIDVELDMNEIPDPMVDESEIRQLVLNMARNGMEAMSERGRLTIGTRLEEEQIVLYIKDEGHGLNPDLLDKLGTPFLTTKENGTGLGLAVCYSIAARHHAIIDYDTSSAGTTFYVRFPLADSIDMA